MPKPVRYVQIVGTLPHNKNPDVSRLDRRRKIVVGPIIDIAGFRAQFEKETMRESSTRRGSPEPRYAVKFAFRYRSRYPKDVVLLSPTTALSLQSWLPAEWFEQDQVETINQVIEVEPSTPSFADAMA